MIKLKDLLSETSISMGQVHSNPYATCFKSPEEIKPVNEGMIDLVIKRALEKDLKSAGIKVKSFKKDISVMGKRAPNGKTIVWGGVFKTKNAVIPISVASEGSVFYQDRHIGVINKGSKVKDNFRSLKVSNKWVESVDETITSKGWNQSKKFIKILDREVKNIKKYHNQQNDEDFFEVIDYMQLQLNTLKRDMKKFNESITEKVARPMSYRLRKAQDEIEYMITQGPLDDEDVYSNSGQAMKLLQTAQKALGKIK